jgi:IclR family pca regulon transcriptional regulator
MQRYKPINSLLKGLKILEAFTYPKFMLTFQELTSKTEMPKATVFRFLRTLTSNNYLSFDSESQKYFMGPRVMSLGFAVLSSLDLKDVALPYLQELSKVSDQNVNLVILDRTQVVYIECISKWDLLKINVRVGTKLNSYQTSSGRILLAFLSPERFQRVLGDLLKDPETVRDIGPNGQRLIALLENVRRLGYAVNDEEYLKGVRAIAAPIFNAGGDIEAAINMPVFSHRVTLKELIKRYLPLLLDTAGNISAARGYHIKGKTKHLPKGSRMRI